MKEAQSYQLASTSTGVVYFRNFLPLEFEVQTPSSSVGR